MIILIATDSQIAIQQTLWTLPSEYIQDLNASHHLRWYCSASGCSFVLLPLLLLLPDWISCFHPYPWCPLVYCPAHQVGRIFYNESGFLYIKAYHWLLFELDTEVHVLTKTYSTLQPLDPYLILYFFCYLSPLTSPISGTGHAVPENKLFIIVPQCFHKWSSHRLKFSSIRLST